MLIFLVLMIWLLLVLLILVLVMWLVLLIRGCVGVVLASVPLLLLPSPVFGRVSGRRLHCRLH
jgi:hypothetical protein